MKNIYCKLDYLLIERNLRKLGKHLADRYIWITKTGVQIPLNKMSDAHLNNCISLLEKVEIDRFLLQEAGYNPAFDNY